MKYLGIAIFMFMLLNSIQAQKFSVNNVDDSNYPTIKVKVEIDESEHVQQSDFKLIESGNETPFTFKNVESASTSKTVCFLIEASGYTYYQNRLKYFKEAVKKSIDNLGDDDMINVCYFGKANNEGKSTRKISAEFTKDKDVLKQEIDNIKAIRDTNYIADVYKSIDECLDFIDSKEGLPGTKMLIVLSRAKNTSRSPISADDCIDKSLKVKIPVYTLTFHNWDKYSGDNFKLISYKTNDSYKSVELKTDNIS